MQAEVNRGVDPCPGLASPKIALDHQGLTLDGALLAPAAAVPNLSGSTTADNAAFKATLRAPTQKFPSLDTDLVGRRQLWKMLHPADTFAPLVDLTAPPDTAAAQVASVIRSVAWAGFDKFHLRSGDILVDFRYALPRPAGAAVDAIVHVRATGSFRDMTKVIQSKVLDPDTSVAFDAVP